MSTLDQILINVYKNMIQLNTINNVSNNTTIFGSTTNLSYLNILGNCIFNNNLTINSNLNIYNNTICINNTSLLSNLYVNNNLMTNNITTTGFLNISNNTYLNNMFIKNNAIFGNVSTNNIFNNSNSCNINSNMQTNSIVALNNQLNINGNIIYIGNITSNINFYGTSITQAVNELIIVDKLISLNLNYTRFSGLDLGNNSGIQFYGANGTGFILTSDNAQQYQIKVPKSNTINYINTIGLDQSLVVTGNSYLINNLSVISSLYVSNNSILNGSATILSSLNVSNQSIFNNNFNINGKISCQNINMKSSISIGSNLFISNNSQCNNCNVNNNLFISNYSQINNSMTINSTLNISGATNILNITTLGSLNISGYSIFSTNISSQSSLLVSGNTILNSVSLSSNLNVLGNVFISGNSQILSNINCSSNSIINGNITFGSLLNGITALTQLQINGSIIAQLPEYLTNSSAAINGVPLWGFYRTGGIIKVRLYNILPIINISGLSTIYINTSGTYTDLGATVTAAINETLIPYIISINNGTTELISTPIAANISNNLTSLLNTSITNNWTITYSATDSYGNTGTATRSIIITTFNTSINTYTLGNPNSIIGPITNNYYNLINNSDFTVECWVYMTKFVSGATNLINLYNGTTSRIVFLIDPSGYLGLYVDPSRYGINITSLKIPLYTWTHIVWMRKNNNLYGFINGIISSATVVNSALNGLSTINTLSMGNAYFGNSSSGGSINCVLFGSVSQPLIMNTAKYSLSSFNSSINLTPANSINVLFFVTNNQDIITLTTVPTIGVVETGNRYLTNYISAYDVTNGWLGPLVKNYNNMNNVDWTIEAWIYQTSYTPSSANVYIFDFFGYPWVNTNTFVALLSSDNSRLGFINYTGSTSYSTNNVSLNMWTHCVWMRLGQNLYTFINGVCNLVSSNPSWINNLTGINSVLLGSNGNTMTSQGPTSKTNGFLGQISQPLIRLGAKYSIAGFTPAFDLTPSSSDTSVLFFMNNNATDTITGQTLTINNTIANTNRYYINNNFTNSNYNNNNYVTAYNFNNGWLGKEIYNFTPIINNNDFTIELWLYISTTTTTGSSIASGPILDFRDPSSWDSSSGTAGWLGPQVQTDIHTNKCLFGINKNYNIGIWFGNYGNDYTYPISNQTVKLNQWNHVVWMRKNNVYYGILNGYSDYSVAISAFNNYGNTLTNLSTISLGRAVDFTQANANYQYYGYMSQVLIRNGAQYNPTTTFVPQLDLSSLANGSNTAFYLNQNYTDVANNIPLPQRFNVPLANRYLSYLPAYDTTKGVLGAISGNYNVLNGVNWTMEAWIYQTARGTWQNTCIFDFRNPSNIINSTTLTVGLVTAGYLSIYSFDIGNDIIISQNTIPLNTWTHVVWMRNNNNLYSFINGVPGNAVSMPSAFNNLTNMNYIVIGGASDQIASNSGTAQFNGVISQAKITLGVMYDPALTFIPSTDLKPTIATNNIFFLDSNNTDIISGNILTRKNMVQNSWRSNMSKFIPTYDGTSNILYRYNSYTSLNTATSWTCEGWIYTNSLDSNWRNILSTTDMNNYVSSGKMEIGYVNNTLSMQSSSGNLVYSTTGINSALGIRANSWNHFSVVQNNSTIYFYINGNACGTTSAMSLTSTSVIQINGAPDRLSQINRSINGRYAQITLMTFAKYTSEFIPEPDLTPLSFTNYLIFLGNNGIDLVSSTNLSVYNNNTLNIKNNLMPI
jgi:carbonic anhydrase/acetyltransferase-like protein (isoleucine patch superfamily)